MENKIGINSKYKAKISFDDYSSVNDIIISYYLPLIRSEAFSLYSALTIDARNTMINSMFVSIERLISMINLSIDSIEKSIARLELVNLIEVLKDTEGRVVFNIKRPLSPEEFNNSPQMVELLKGSAGNDNLQINNRLFNSMKDKSIVGFKSLSKDIDLSTTPKTVKAALNVEYDFDSIKNVLVAKNIDWSNYWSTELEERLLNLIVIYKITSFDIAIELIKEIETGKFNVECFVSRIKEEFIRNTDIDSIISAGEETTEIKLDFLSQMPVKDYFIHKLSRVPSPTESEMITKLINKYGFNSYQINILIDYSLIVNDGAINKNYIYKIADTALKENINTPEKLIQHLKVSYKMKKDKKTNTSLDANKQMIDVPEF